jgi:tetratricopeptide (TPR) repeat protein
MSPEQAGGDLEHLGPRSDVYSLGATLYYLLTGRPPVKGETGEMLRAVQTGEFPPPRQHVPTIDRALEAVCLKAMAHKPGDRYVSPKALSDDVERWMADEPTSAWREPLARRARRWAKRNRTAVTAAAVALLAGVVGLSVVVLVQTQAKADIARALGRETQANSSLAAANDELSRSKAAVQARFELAAEAIKAFHTGVSEDFLLKQDQFEELRDRLLKSAADFYGKLGASLGKETDVASRRALAASNFELANLTAKVGRPEDALATHRSVLAAREALALEPQADAAATVDVGRSLTAVAGVLEATGKTDEALAAYRRSESLLAGPANADPLARAALAACRTGLGNLLSGNGKQADALTAYRLARADQVALASVPGATDGTRRDLADTLVSIGNRLGETGRPKEAESEYRAALAIYRGLAEAKPAVTQFRNRLALCHTNLGWVLATTGRPKEAESEYRAALAIQEELAGDNPAVTQFRSLLALSHTNLGRLLSVTGRPKEAESEHRAALAIDRKLAEDHRAVTEFRTLLARSHTNLGLLLSQTGRPSEAESEHRAALAIQEELAGAEPARPDRRRHVGMSLNNLGDLDTDAGRLDAAVARFRESVALHDRLVGEHPTVSDYRSGLGFALSGLGRALHRAGRRGEADGPLRQAAAVREVIPALSLEARFDLARDLALLASAAAPRRGPVTVSTTAEADLAMDALRRTIAAGYRDAPARIRDDPDLAALRDRADFKLLMMDLAMPAEPFAGAR